MSDKKDISEKIENNLYILYFTCSVILTAVFVVTYGYYDEASRYLMLEEDGIVEWLSAAFWLTGGLLAIAAIIFKPKDTISKLSYIIPVAGILAFLDETSFVGLLSGKDNPYSSGAKNASEHSPIIIGGYVIDGVHDLFSIMFKIWRDYTGIWGYIVGSILLGGIVGIAVAKRKSYMPKIMKRIRQHPELNLFRIAVIMVLCAMVLDLNIIKSHWATFAEETLETLGGLTIFFAGLYMLVKSPKKQDNVK